MVGFVYNNNPTVKEEKEEGEENFNQPLQHNKSNENDPFDFSFTELEDFSLPFIDSFMDFSGWFEEKPDSSMADFKVDDSDKVDSGIYKFLRSVETSTPEGSVRLENLGSLIEEELGKVNLGREVVGGGGNGVKSDGIASVECEIEKNGEIVGIVGDGVGISEVVSVVVNVMKDGDKLTADKRISPTSGDIVSNGDSESSSASSSSSSSSDDDDDDEEEEEEEEEKKKEIEEEMDMEEGEIRGFEGEQMVAWSDDEDDVGGGKAETGPIRSKNELQVLPPVPPVNVTIQPYHQTRPVGVVLSIIGAQVIVEGVEKHNPLSEGSILWITETRSPLGLIDEIFGPVKNPYYVVRYNSESEVPTGIHQGSSISFVPEFADYVLNNNNLYKIMVK